MRPTRGLGSAPLPRTGCPAAGCALLFGLAPGRVCRVSPRRPEPADSSLWHWSSPRGGRALPATLRWGARTFLEASPEGPAARPSGRLAGPGILRPARAWNGRGPVRPPDDDRRAAGPDAIDRLVGQGVGGRVLGARDVVGRPAPEAAKRPPDLGVERDDLEVLDPPAAVDLLHDQLRVEEQVDFGRA